MSDDDFDQLVTGSSLFKHYAAQRGSILRHQKRIECQEHRSIDFDTALVDWMLKRRRNSKWLRNRKLSG
jgi:hypothetical protein